MHNAALAALGLNWRYLAFDVHPDDLPAAIAGAKAMKFIGLNLTVPHKLLALEIVDALDESARTWGAVNTIRFEAPDSQGQWHPLAQVAEPVPQSIHSRGFNTDADALIQSLREDLEVDLCGASVLLLGAGGAGRVAALKLRAEGVGALFLVNRTGPKAEELAREIHQADPKQKVIVGYPSGPVDLVINATSLGLKADDPLPFDESRFSMHRARAVYDMIYRPAQTAFLKTADAAGCRTANGLGMLLYQGARALELWTRKSAPIEVMRGALKRNIY